MPIIRYDSPYYGPLTRSAWFLYASMNYIFVKGFFKLRSGVAFDSRRHLWILMNYRRRMFGGVEKAAEETVSAQSSEIDIRIFDWTIGVLGDDDSLEKFFEAIPGFFNSKLVGNLEREFPEDIFWRFWSTLDKFMKRTLSSNSVTESVRSRRVIICRDIMNSIPCPFGYGTLSKLVDQAPVSIGSLQVMARWLKRKDEVADHARVRVANNLTSLQERDGDWIAFASGVSGLAEHNLRDNITYVGDNLLLATLIDVSRRAFYSNRLKPVKALSQFNVCHTLPGLQHDFCTLWNEIVQESRIRDHHAIAFGVLRRIRHHYIALHQGTDAAPTAFSASTGDYDYVLYNLSSYPLCDIASHRPDSTAHVPVPNSRVVPLLTQHGNSPDGSPHHSISGGRTVSRQVNEASAIEGPPLLSDPTTPSGIKDNSQAPAATSPALPVHTTPRPTDVSPPGAVSNALKDIPATTLCRPLKQDTAAQCAAPDISEIPSTVDPTPRSIPTISPTISSPSSPILLPVLSSGMTARPPSFALIEPDHVPHTHLVSHPLLKLQPALTIPMT
jgi:hypothetical protein